jgi:hypothetical protein
MTDMSDNSGAVIEQPTPTPDNVNANANATPNASAVTNPPPVENKPAEEKPVASTWRDDWRNALSKGDAKELNRLARFASPEAVYDAYRALEARQSAAKPTPTLPENPTPEQLNEYRKQVGVPEKFEGYYEKLPKGLVIGEEDKPAMDMLAEALHSKNAHPDLVATVVDTYYKIVERNQEEMVEVQTALKQETSDALRAEWGPDYRPTINAIGAMLDGVDPDTKQLLEGMQLADGSLAFNHQGFMRWIGSLALQINPASLVLPGSDGGDKQQTVKSQIEANVAEMRKNINAWQSPANAARRQEHMRLLEAADKFGIKF